MEKHWRSCVAAEVAESEAVVVVISLSGSGGKTMESGRGKKGA